jgi:hypothetical protein
MTRNRRIPQYAAKSEIVSYSLAQIGTLVLNLYELARKPTNARELFLLVVFCNQLKLSALKSASQAYDEGSIPFTRSSVSCIFGTIWDSSG